MEIEAIPTEYRGYRFRSRLEARWAVFFDALKIAFEYEPEGFQLSDGTRYLPDFRLPRFHGGIWVEVKPLGDPFTKARQFAHECHESMWLAEGPPDFRVYGLITTWEHGADCPCCSSTQKQNQAINPRLEVAEIDGIPCWDSAEGEQRMFTSPGYENPDGSIPEDMLNPSQSLYRAVMASRAARFEPSSHGRESRGTGAR